MVRHNLKNVERTGQETLMTRDYNNFKLIVSNRDVQNQHYERLKKSIKEHGQMVPIIVDGNGNVYEGQHRLLACKELNIPVRFIVNPVISLDDISELNSQSRNWKIDDYLKHHAERDVKDYIKLREIINQHKELNLDTTHFITIFSSDSGKVIKNFQDGKYTITQEARGKEVLALYYLIKDFVDTNPSQIFFRSLAKLLARKVNIERLVSKVKMRRFRKIDTANIRYYMLEWEEVYNFKEKKEHVRIY